MTDDTKSGEKTLSLPQKSTLSLKGSSGTLKAPAGAPRGPRGVVVETIGMKKKPSYAPVFEKAPERPATPAQPAFRGQAPSSGNRPTFSSRPASGMVLQTLTAEEREARSRALNVASAQEAEDRKRAEAEQRRRAEEEARRNSERSEDERRKRDEEDRHRREEDTRRLGEQEARKRYQDQQREEQISQVLNRSEARVVTRTDGTRGDDNRPMNLNSPRPVRASTTDARAEEQARNERSDNRSRPDDKRPTTTRTDGQRTDGTRPPRPAGDRPFGDRPPRPAGDRPQGDRPYGDRPPRTDGTTGGYRSDGTRPPRPAGDRPYGDRPPRTDGTTGGYRTDGTRPPRPAGDRPYGDRPPRTDGAPSRFGGPRTDGRPPSLNSPRTPRITTPLATHVPPPQDTHAARLASRGSQKDRDEEELNARKAGAKAALVKVTKTKGDDKIRSRLTVTNAYDEGADTRGKSDAAFRRRMQKKLGKNHQEVKEKIMREVVIPETISIQDLANRMTERAVDVVRLLMKQGMMLKISDSIDADTAQLIAEEMGHTVRRVADSDVEDGLFTIADEEGDLVTRAPVVTIMGHVDHGKTSLLDAIRTTNVVSGEAGGITQHIGAYQVKTPLGGLVTFIDTPGHAAFTQMRARGAKVTDIVILVVAADDGVKPQTIEAISHAKAAKVPLIVAINKIDKPDANPQKVRTELLQYEIQVESLGGETIEVEVSAKQRLNLDKLLELIQLQAEVMDLKANPNRPAEGSVIEAKLDKGRGAVPTVLIERGTLRVGDIVVAGTEWGRVRALINDKGEAISEAIPSLPVEVLGFSGAPEAGDRMAVVESEAKAREITNYRIHQKREKAAAKQSKASGSLSDMFNKLKTQVGKKEITLIIKGDVQGSVEAIVGSLEKLGNDEVGARVLHSGVGGITESDITLGESTNSVVIGFNVRALKEAREASERLGVEIRYYNIIYDLVDDIKAAMSGMLAPTLRETFLGNAKMLEIFNITKVGKVAGCQVIEGRMERGAQVRLVRDNVVIHQGKLSTLKRFKDEVKEVQIGQECGMAFENYEDIRAGDLIECFTVESIKRTL